MAGQSRNTRREFEFPSVTTRPIIARVVDDTEQSIELTYSAHARLVIAERGIRFEWVCRVWSNPEKRERDRFDHALEHALGRIPESGDRVLRIVYDPSVRPAHVVAAYFDRSMRNRL